MLFLSLEKLKTVIHQATKSAKQLQILIAQHQVKSAIRTQQWFYDHNINTNLFCVVLLECGRFVTSLTWLERYKLSTTFNDSKRRNTLFS